MLSLGKFEYINSNIENLHLGIVVADRDKVEVEVCDLFGLLSRQKKKGLFEFFGLTK